MNDDDERRDADPELASSFAHRQNADAPDAAATADATRTITTRTTPTRTSADAGHPDAPLETITVRPNRKSTRQLDNDGESSTGGRRVAGSATRLEVVEDPSSGSGTSTPRFLQDEGTWKRWRWIPYRVRRVWKIVVRWSYGPPNPQPYRIKPLFPAVQEYPLYLMERFLPGRKRRFWALFFYFSIWLITFVLLKRDGTLATEVEGWGTPEVITCGTTYWSAGNMCGVDGNNCRPFNGSGFPFRCNAKCEGTHLLNPRAVGDQEINYRPLVVGGPPNGAGSQSDLQESAVYRGDSFICAAAIHAGVITNAAGGCGVVELIGQTDNFVSTDRNGIVSVGFDSYFPLSFRFHEDAACEARDVRWSLLAVSAVFTGVLSVFTSDPAVFFFPNFVGIFWTIGTAMDPPPHRSVASLFANIIGKFLPAMFCAWAMFDKMGIRRTLTKLTAQFEKAILWLGPCWVGAMDNYTLSFIPIARLNAHDLQQQPGAKAALAIIIIVLVAIIGTQVYFFRQEGRFRKYIALYALFVFGILISLAVPGVSLRIHHYILALLLLPGTSLQTRPCLIYQGLLVGLFINGIARWGFDPVLQTPASLQGDAQKGSVLPRVLPPVIDLVNVTAVTAGGYVPTSNITFKWEMPSESYIDGISILVNDVERFRSYFEDQVAQEDSFVWSRKPDLDLPEYFRFSFMEGSTSGDYTKAGVWTADGDWVKMKSGPSKVKVRSLGEDERVKRR